MDNLDLIQPQFSVMQFVEISSTTLVALQEPIRVDRVLLSQTWWKLLNRLAGKHPNVIEKTMIEAGYRKIVERMDAMTDEELLDDMAEIIDAVDFARLRILPPLDKKKRKWDK